MDCYLIIWFSIWFVSTTIAIIGLVKPKILILWWNSGMKFGLNLKPKSDPTREIRIVGGMALTLSLIILLLVIFKVLRA